MDTDRLDPDLTTEEQRAIAILQRLAKRWPKTLWLYSASGTLNVMRCLPNGKHAMEPGLGAGADIEYRIATVDIPNDGGDW